MAGGSAIAAVWLAVTLLNLAILPGRYATRVELERTALSPMALVVRATGNLEAKDSNTVKAQFEGPVVSKQFHEGQTVTKGQLLAVLSREKIRLDHQNKLNDLKNAKSDLSRARKDVKIQRELFRQEAVAYSTVEDAERTFVRAQQSLRSAEEAFRLAEDQWAGANILSPLTGTVVKDWIGDDKTIAGGKEIVTVADVSEYTLKAYVDELDIKQVHEGQPAKIRIQIFDQAMLSGVVKEVGSQPEGAGLPEVPVILSLTDTQGLALRPKLTAEAKILTGTTEPVLSVPLTAVANSDGDPRVWVLGTFGRIHTARVVLGRMSPDRIEVTQGLRPGERVCISAEPDFAERMKVVMGVPDSLSSKTHALMKTIKKGAASQKGNFGPQGVFIPASGSRKRP